MAGNKKVLVGVVRSNKMQKTVVVECERKVLQPKYKKYLRKKTRYYAHDEKNECAIGDRVMIMETRPLSRLKRWRVIKKIER